jgi:hypothetical protein
MVFGDWVGGESDGLQEDEGDLWPISGRAGENPDGKVLGVVTLNLRGKRSRAPAGPTSNPWQSTRTRTTDRGKWRR